MNREWFSVADLAGLSGLPGTERGIRDAAKREDWESRKKAKGKGQEYHIRSLPDAARAGLRLMFAQASFDENQPPKSKSSLTVDPEVLQQRYAAATENNRAKGQMRAEACRRFVALTESGIQGMTTEKALKIVAREVAAEYKKKVAWGSVRRWYYGNSGKRAGAVHYQPGDWAAALIDLYKGNKTRKEITAEAWDWFCKAYFCRRSDTFKECFRRLEEAAKKNGWTIPGEKAIRKRVDDLDPAEVKFLREGSEALRDMYPPMRRNPLVFDVGEAVSGDGLKISLYVDWGDEIITTSTVWCWKDIRTGRMLAHYLGKTENTDIFRLSVYRLTGICRPTYVQIDNTTAAANKPMTAGQPGRRRFKDRPEDPDGVLSQLGMTVHWSDPNHSFTTPGSKVIERDFRDLHGKITGNPAFKNRGFSIKTAVPVAELETALEQEIARHNAQLGRQHPACKGKLSFDQAWHEAVDGKTLPVATDEQRELCLLLPEVVHVHQPRGEVFLSAGRSELGKPRYWTEALARHVGTKVAVYYDPDNLSRPLRVNDSDGVYICHAVRQEDTAFNSIEEARENRKGKARFIKATKAAAKEKVRMTDMEFRRLSGTPETPLAPVPKIQKAKFGKTPMYNENGDIVDPETGEILRFASENEQPRQAVGDDFEPNFIDQMERMAPAFWENHPLALVRSDNDQKD